MKRIVMILISAALLLSLTSISVFAGNTWVDPQLSEAEGGFIDANRNGQYKEVAYRFAIRDGGQLVAIYAALIGSDKNAAEDGPSTFDFAIYNWTEDYATTVQQEPVEFRDNLQYSVEDLNANLYYMFNLENPLGAGQYLVVLSDFDVAWALRNYIFQPSMRGEFLTYINGEEYDNTMWWSLLFADGNDWWGDTPLNADPDATESTEAPATSETPAVTNQPDDTTQPDTETQAPATETPVQSTAPNVIDTDTPATDPEGAPIGLIIGIAAAVVVVVVVVVIIVRKKHSK